MLGRPWVYDLRCFSELPQDKASVACSGNSLVNSFIGFFWSLSSFLNCAGVSWDHLPNKPFAIENLTQGLLLRGSPSQDSRKLLVVFSWCVRSVTDIVLDEQDIRPRRAAQIWGSEWRLLPHETGCLPSPLLNSPFSWGALLS